jgi:hypothetical protein
LAEAAKVHEQDPFAYFPEEIEATRVYYNAVSPDRILALLDRLDKAEAALREIANGPVRQADGAWRQDIAAKALQGERSEYMPALTSTDKEPE